MQVEIKLLLQDVSDYHCLNKALESRFIGEQSYCDYFFDFMPHVLEESGAVLRLRAPCVKPESTSSPVQPEPSLATTATESDQRGVVCGASVSLPPASSTPFAATTTESAPQPALSTDRHSAPTRSYHSNELDEFLGTPPRAPAAAGKNSGNEGMTVAAAAAAGVGDGEGLALRPPAPFSAIASATTARRRDVDDGDSRQRGGNGQHASAAAAAAATTTAAHLLPQPGKLVLKSHNRVEKGFQMNATIEDTAVPFEAVERLVSGGEDAFAVLSAYAATTADEHSPARRIVRKLKTVKAEYGLDEAPAEDAHAPQQRRRRTESTNTANLRCDNEEESHERSAAAAENAGFGLVGSYTTTRKEYHFLLSSDGNGSDEQREESDAAPLQGRPLGEKLRIRVDRTVFPFGERYELEVPRVDVAADDVMHKLERFLKSLHIKYLPGNETKYERFVKGQSSLRCVSKEVQEVKLRLPNDTAYQEVRKNLDDVTRRNAARRKRTRSEQRQIFFAPQADESPERDASDEVEEAHLPEEEWHENFFFDGPNDELREQHCLLRLRRLQHGKREINYVLVLKEQQSFVNGRQGNRTRSAELPEDIAEELLANPRAFLTNQHTHNAVAVTLWNDFRLRELHRCASFTTHRLIVPWWASTAQVPSAVLMQRVGQTEEGVPRETSVGRVSSTTQSLRLSQQIQEQHTGHVTVPPLLVRLDRSQYVLPSTMGGGSNGSQPSHVLLRKGGTRYPTAPPSGTLPVHVHGDLRTGERTYELYEMEVTNLVTATPSQVIEELTGWLDGLGVEWQTGVQSKLEQYLSLLESASTSASLRHSQWSTQVMQMQQEQARVQKA